MILSGVSMIDSLASMATNRANVQVQSQISMAILKSHMNQQKVQAAALVRMIKSSSIDGTGTLVDIYT